MLKDMADSKRIDDHIQGTAKVCLDSEHGADIQSVVHPLVISRMFWPNMPASSLHLPPKLQRYVLDLRDHAAPPVCFQS
jgi:anaphase-promoting complex subunit 2